MSRPIVRAMTAIAAAAALAGVSFVAVPAATAGVLGPAVTGLTATPAPPRVVSISWDAYPDFVVDHYVAKLQPGNRTVTNFAIDPQPTTATFGDLSWGTDYSATVTAFGAAPTDISTAATLEVPGTKLSASVSPSNATRGATTQIRGTLHTRHDKPIANVKVQVQVKYLPGPPFKFQDLDAVKTNKNGAFGLTFKANRNADYQVLYKGAGTAGGWDSGMHLAVRVPVSLKFSANPVRFGQKVKFTGALNCKAALVAGAPIRLQHKVSGRWKTAKSSTVNANGKYAIGYKPTSRDDQAWRVITEAGDSFATSTSKAKVLTVR